MCATLEVADYLHGRGCRFREFKAYILERRDALREESLGGGRGAGKAAKGFAA